MKTVDSISGIAWFTNVGRALPAELEDVVSVTSWQQAIQSCSDPGWEDVCTEARNELTMHLNAVCKSEFQRWNDVINGIKHELQEPWERMRQFLEENRLPSVVAECAEWDTLHAAATEHYTTWDPPQFFLRLLAAYEQGRFPCGWEGNWPEGTIRVY